MPPAIDRRRFLGTGGLAAALAAGPIALTRALAPDAAPLAPDTLFLTWFRDPTTTIAVQWVGPPLPNDSLALWYRPRGTTEWVAGAGFARKPFPVIESWLGPLQPTGLVVYRAELTKLTPGTEYEFTIDRQSSAYRFRTMPAKATNAFHFVSGGDCGVNAHAVANNKIAAAQDPMFALIGGDLGYDNGVSGHTAVRFLRNYSTTMIDSQGRLIPLVACLGNHEVRGGYGKSFKNATFFAPLFGGLYHETSYATLDFGDYLSLVLTDTGHCSLIPGEQTAWLDKALADRAGRPHLIAVGHVPCYPSFRPPTGEKGKNGTGEAQRKHWVPLYEKHQVDVVLEHHDHTFKRTRPLTGGAVDEATGIVYLGDGSWGRLRAANPAERRPYLAEVSSTYHLTLHRLEGEQRFHLALGETGKVLDVCRTVKRPRRRTPGLTTG